MEQEMAQRRAKRLGAVLFLAAADAPFCGSSGGFAPPLGDPESARSPL